MTVRSRTTLPHCSAASPRRRRDTTAPCSPIVTPPRRTAPTSWRPAPPRTPPPGKVASRGVGRGRRAPPRSCSACGRVRRRGRRPRADGERGARPGLRPRTASRYLDRDEDRRDPLSTSGGIPASASRSRPRRRRHQGAAPDRRFRRRSRRAAQRRRDRAHRRPAGAVRRRRRHRPDARARRHAGQLSVRRRRAAGWSTSALERAQVEVHSVAAESLESGYGYLRISSFSDTTARDVTRALGNCSRAPGRGPQGPGHRPAQQPLVACSIPRSRSPTLLSIPA